MCGDKNKCQPCGGNLQPACTYPASPCKNVLPPLKENDDGICITTPCGLQAQACCASNVCKQDWTTCVGNTCISCGTLGAPACQGMLSHTHLDRSSLPECLWLLVCAVATPCIVCEQHIYNTHVVLCHARSGYVPTYMIQQVDNYCGHTGVGCVGDLISVQGVCARVCGDRLQSCCTESGRPPCERGSLTCDGSSCVDCGGEFNPPCTGMALHARSRR